MEEENEVVIVTNVYGDICLRKKTRRKRQKMLVKELMYDYAKNTTLHGLPYVTRPGLTFMEKLFWIFTFIASVCMCLYLIYQLWIKWQTSPVIVTVSEQLVPVHEVPFPSVTICPQSKSKVSVYNFTDEEIKMNTFMSMRSTINETMRQKLAKHFGISEICGIPAREFRLSEIYPNNYTDASVVKHILEVAPDYKDVFFHCIFHAAVRTCSSLFDKVLTSEGLCYNMNSLAAENIFRTNKVQTDYKYLYTKKPINGWSVEEGRYNKRFSFKDAGKRDVYPVPGAENGKSADIEVILHHKPDERDHMCNGLNSGYKVYIHYPTDLPQSSLYYYAILNSQVSSMALSFSILTTKESLRRYDAVKRQCYFPDERHLKYFNIYTASNCAIECLSNITYKYCGCVGFYMPSESSKKICTYLQERCMMNARRIMQDQEITKDSTRCHCLPACDSMDYDAEILKTEFNLKQLMESRVKAFNYSFDWYKRYNFSKLEMYFKRPRFLSMRRSELYGVIDFLSNCGGLLGLFLGFSFLSLIEIFYFLSLRLCCTLKKDLEEEKAQKESERKVHLEKF